jgi:hypothetical protein
MREKTKKEGKAYRNISIMGLINKIMNDNIENDK